jgi:hypothetical protein
MKIPLNPPFQRGKLHLPFVKGGGEGFKKVIFKIMPMNEIQNLDQFVLDNLDSVLGTCLKFVICHWGF